MTAESKHFVSLQVRSGLLHAVAYKMSRRVYVKSIVDWLL